MTISLVMLKKNKLNFTNLLNHLLRKNIITLQGEARGSWTAVGPTRVVGPTVMYEHKTTLLLPVDVFSVGASKQLHYTERSLLACRLSFLS